jgi:hypothetical protein
VCSFGAGIAAFLAFMKIGVRGSKAILSATASEEQALGFLNAGRTHLNFFSFYFTMFKGHVFWIRGGGEAALLLAKPAALQASAVSLRSGLGNAVAIRKPATPTTASAQMKLATI